MVVGARAVLALCSEFVHSSKWLPLDGVVFKKSVGPPAHWSYRSAEVVRSRWSLGVWGFGLRASGFRLQGSGFRGQELVNKEAVLPISRVLGGGLLAQTLWFIDSLMASCGAWDGEGRVLVAREGDRHLFG